MPQQIIYFVTSNKGKVASAERVLKKYGIRVIQKELDSPESRGSFEEIALGKARYGFKILKKPLMVMDSGFFIDSLNGFPMMFTNFALKTIGVEGLVKLVEGKDKSCEFREVLCFIESAHKKPKLFTRVVKGKISGQPLGEMKDHFWSKLHLIFIPEGKTKTLAEMTDKEYRQFQAEVEKDSHFDQFGRFYSKA